MAQHILIADDDRQIVRLVQSYLEQAGFVVRTAHDGEQALHLLRAERPDLAVLDVMMPGRDGFELVRQRVYASDREREERVVLVGKSEAVRLDAEPEALRIAIEGGVLG
jgi:DNA-binding response OmpR family regulator